MPSSGPSRPLSRWVPAAVALALLLPLLPAGASAAEPIPFIVQFDEVPAGLAPGSLWHGGRVTQVDRTLGFAVVSFAGGPRASAWSDPSVLDLRPDLPVRLIAATTPNDPRFPSQYGPQQMRLPLAWDLALGGPGAAVCVIDSGIDLDHPDLAASYVAGFNTVSPGPPQDDNGHGTHVAGIAAAAIGNGIGIAGAANVAIYAAKVLNSAGSGTVATVASGIQWCADSTPPGTVINLSLGFSCRGASSCESANSPTLAAALDYAAGKGKLIVAASGNDGCLDCVGYPARHPAAIAVGCTTAAQAICSFSSRGPKVELSAPGHQVLSTVPSCAEADEICSSSGDGYAQVSGTSMSSPHVAGLAALLWSQEPTLTASELRERLRHASQDLGAKGRDPLFGYGRADAACLLGAVANPAPVAADDAFQVSVARTLRLLVLANDSDADCSGFDVSLDSTGTLGGVSLSGGEVVYVPPANFIGTDTFHYTLTDGNASDTATVTVTVAPPTLCAQAGPDAFGHRCYLEDLPFTDIRSTGTAVQPGASVPIGFGFRFYGAAKSRVTVSDQGVLLFGAKGSQQAPASLPDPAGPNQAIAAAWGSIVPGTGSLHALTSGTAPHRTFTVQWTDARHAAGGLATLQAILHEGSNAIDIVHGSMDWAGAGVVGIEDGSGRRGLTAAKGLLPASGLDYRFWLPAADVQVAAGEVAAVAGEAFTLPLTLANGGPNATVATARLTLPTRLAFNGTLPEGCARPSQRTAVCTLPLAPGESLNLSFPVLATRAATFTLAVAGASSVRDPWTADNRATWRVTVATPGP